MPTLAELGVVIDPTAAKTGGATVEDVLGRIEKAAVKMAEAVDRFAGVAEKSMGQGAQALGNVEKAAEKTGTALKETGAAAQEGGAKITAAATTATVSTIKLAKSTDQVGTAHKEASTAAATALKDTAQAANTAISAENKLAEAATLAGVASRDAAQQQTAALDAGVIAARQQADALLQAETAARAYQQSVTQASPGVWTRETADGIQRIVDTTAMATVATDATAAAQEKVRVAVTLTAEEEARVAERRQANWQAAQDRAEAYWRSIDEAQTRSDAKASEDAQKRTAEGQAAAAAAKAAQAVWVSAGPGEWTRTTAEGTQRIVDTMAQAAILSQQNAESTKLASVNTKEVQAAQEKVTAAQKASVDAGNAYNEMLMRADTNTNHIGLAGRKLEEATQALAAAEANLVNVKTAALAEQEKLRGSVQATAESEIQAATRREAAMAAAQERAKEYWRTIEEAQQRADSRTASGNNRDQRMKEEAALAKAQAQEYAKAQRQVASEAARLASGNELGKLTLFGQSLQKNSTLLMSMASLMGPAERSVVRLSSGFGLAAIAAEKLAKSNGDYSTRQERVAQMTDLVQQRQAGLVKVQEAASIASHDLTAAQHEYAAVAKDVEGFVNAEAAAQQALAQAQRNARTAASELREVNRSGTATTADKAAATRALTAAQSEVSTAQKVTKTTTADLQGAMTQGLIEAERLAAAEKAAVVASRELEAAHRGVIEAQRAQTAAAEAGGAGMLGLAGTILPLLGMLAALAVVLGAVYAAWKLFTNSIQAGSQFVTLHSRLAQFVGDANLAHQAMEDLEELSARTGLDLPDLETGTARMMAFGASLNEAKETMQDFATLAVRSGKDAVAALTTAYITARDQGTVGAMQLRQLRQASVDILPQLRASTGLTGIQLQHMLTQGGISFNQLSKAIHEAANATDVLGIRAKTPEGAFVNMRKKWEELQRRIGEPFTIALVPLMDVISHKLEGLRDSADGMGMFGANMVYAIKGAIENGELGQLIYATITEGARRGWSYMDENWFAPAKNYVADIFNAGHFGLAFDAVFQNIGAKVDLWADKAGATVYGYLMEWLGQLRLTLAKIPGLSGIGEGVDTRSASAITADRMEEIDRRYNERVERSNWVYQQKMAEAGIATGTVTGAFGTLAKAVDLAAGKLFGVAAPGSTAPLPDKYATTNTGFTVEQVGKVLRDSMMQDSYQKYITQTISNRPSENELRADEVHNTGVYLRKFFEVMGNPALLSTLQTPPNLRGTSAVSTPPGGRVEAATPIRVERATAVSAFDDLPRDSSEVSNALFANTTAINNLNSGLATNGKAATTAATQAADQAAQKVRLTFYTKWEDKYGDRIAYGGDAARAREGVTAAVDPRLFSYGSTLNIPALQALNGSGNFRAEDTGGAVKSREASGGTVPVIDIYLDASNAADSKAVIAAAQKKFGDYVMLNYNTGANSSNPSNDAGLPKGSDAFTSLVQRSVAKGRAGTSLGLPTGGTGAGMAPERPFNYGTDQDTLTKLSNQVKDYQYALENTLISQTEYNRAVENLRAKAISNLQDPAGRGNAGVGRGIQTYSQQVQNTFGAGDFDGDRLVAQHQLAYQQVEQQQRDIDERMKTNDVGVVDSFVNGVQKQVRSYGTMAQQMQKLGAGIVDSLTNNISEGISDIISGTKDAKTAFKDMAVSILKDISNMIIKMLVLLAIQKLLGMAGAAIGGNTGAALTQISNGMGSQTGMKTGTAHSGGIAGTSYDSLRIVHASAFQHAPRYHGGGILPGEVPIIAKAGEGVFTPQQMARLAPVGMMRGGGSSSQTNSFHTEIHMHSDGQMESKTRSSGEGENTEEMLRRVDGRIKTVLMDETRNGGAFDQWDMKRKRK